MSIEVARQKAAQAWCTPKTERKVMDAELAEAFAVILEEIWRQAWLGNATTRELLDELQARCIVNGTIDYKTTEVSS